MVFNGAPEFNGDRTDESLNPLLIVEVLSPSTVACDRGEKFRKYRSLASFCEYLLVGQAEPYIEQYYNGDRQNSDLWQWQVCDRRSSQEPDRLFKSIYSLDGEEIFPGFTLPIAEFFQKLAFSGKCDVIYLN